MAKLLRRRISGSTVASSKEMEQLDTIIRNAKRLLRLEQNMLDAIYPTIIERDVSD
jgi:hypothetical protein